MGSEADETRALYGPARRFRGPACGFDGPGHGPADVLSRTKDARLGADVFFLYISNARICFFICFSLWIPWDSFSCP